MYIDIGGKLWYVGGIFELRPSNYVLSCYVKASLLSTMKDNSKTVVFCQTDSLINIYRCTGSILLETLFQPVLLISATVPGSV